MSDKILSRMDKLFKCLDKGRMRWVIKDLGLFLHKNRRENLCDVKFALPLTRFKSSVGKKFSDPTWLCWIDIVINQPTIHSPSLDKMKIYITKVATRWFYKKCYDDPTKIVILSKKHTDIFRKVKVLTQVNYYDFDITFVYASWWLSQNFSRNDFLFSSCLA